MKRATATFVLLAALAGCGRSPQPVPPGPGPGPAPDPTVVAARIVAGINKERASRGLSALVTDPRLSVSSARIAADCARRGHLSHTGSDGSTVGSRITATGYRWASCGEVAARGQATSDAAIGSWLGDLPHRAIMLGRGYVRVGAAVARDGRGVPCYFADFASP